MLRRGPWRRSFWQIDRKPRGFSSAGRWFDPIFSPSCWAVRDAAWLVDLDLAVQRNLTTFNRLEHAI